jgi:aryl carrier-like protein
MRIGHDDPPLNGGVPVGRPLEGMHVSLSDQVRAGMAEGHAGEIIVMSRHLAAGYWHEEVTTNLAFAPAPDDPQLTTYLMGDIGTWDANGLLWHRGRRDGQIKIRGFRVETGEIESTLLRHPEVTEAVVTAHEIAPGESRLVAYVITKASPPVTADEMKLHLEPYLPEHMIPTAFIRMAEFPLTVTGKIDRRALPVPDFAALAHRREHVAPRTSTEQLIASLWQELLHLDKVGVHDDFFDLGGHSLRAMQLASRMQQAFGVTVALRDVFAAPTIAKLAPLIEKTPNSLQREPPAGLPNARSGFDTEEL